MTDDTNTGGLAFPQPIARLSGNIHSMTLRDYFAGQVAQRIFEHHMAEGDMTPAQAANVTAKWAYVVADAMIAARQEGGDA